MEFSELEQEVEKLDVDSQRRLMKLLVALDLRRDEAWKAEMGRLIDDKDPANWVSLADARKLLADAP